MNAWIEDKMESSPQWSQCIGPALSNMTRVWQPLLLDRAAGAASPTLSDCRHNNRNELIRKDPCSRTLTRSLQSDNDGEVGDLCAAESRNYLDCSVLSSATGDTAVTATSPTSTVSLASVPTWTG